MPSTITDRLDGLTTSVAVKAPCKAVSTIAITQSGEQTIGGVACVDGDRYLLAIPGGSVLNGLWNARESAHERTADFNGNRDVRQGTLVLTEPGGAATGMWEVMTENDITIGTTVIEIALYIGNPVLVAGGGTNITIANGGVAAAGVRVNAFSWREIAANHTLLLADVANGIATIGNSGTQLITIPPVASVPFAAGDAVLVLQDSAE